MLLGNPENGPGPDAKKLLLIKARLEEPDGEASAPALGLMFLGGAIRAWCGWEVRVLDLYLEGDEDVAVAGALAEYPADVVGVSALTSESHSMFRVAELARKLAPEALILAGGPHPSAYPDECLESLAIDGVAVGEGEVTLAEVLTLYEQGRPWIDVPGMASRQEGGGLHMSPRANIDDLDSLPMPAWDLTDIDAYATRRGQSLTGRRRYLPIMTSRGCPYRCTYCHDIQGKRFRSHSPEYVLEMARYVGEKYGVYNFDIIDDIFNFDGDRLMKICDGFIEDGRIRFAFPNGVRADRMTPAEADKLADAGLEYVGIAIETATKRLQKQIRKHLRFDKVQPVIDRFAARGVVTCGFFMLGFHTEKEHEMQATVQYALESKLHAAFFFVVTPYKGTELFGQVEQDLPHQDFTHGYARQKINLSDVDDAAYFKLRRRAYFDFYRDPARVLRLWKAFPKKWDLPHYAMVTVMHTMRLEPVKFFGPIERAKSALSSMVSKLVGSVEEPHGTASVPEKIYVLPDTPKVPLELFTVVRPAAAAEMGGTLSLVRAAPRTLPLIAE